MAAQRGQAFLRVEGSEDSAKIAQEAAENGQDEDTARWAAVERRLDQADRARLESEARMAHDPRGGNQVLEQSAISPTYAPFFKV